MKNARIFALSSLAALAGFLSIPAAELLGSASKAHAQMSGMSMGSKPGAQNSAEGVGILNSVNVAERKVNITHDPIPEISWPAMTMDFPVAQGVALANIKPGTKVGFVLRKNDKGAFTVESIKVIR